MRRADDRQKKTSPVKKGCVRFRVSALVYLGWRGCQSLPALLDPICLHAPTWVRDRRSATRFATFMALVADHLRPGWVMAPE